jgi:Mu transposase-like protein
MNDYVTIAQAVGLTGYKRRWVEKQIKKGKFQACRVLSSKQKGKFITKILITSLPVAAQKRWLEQTTENHPHPDPLPEGEGIAGVGPLPEGEEVQIPTTRPAPEIGSPDDLPTTPEAALVWYNGLPKIQQARIDERLATLNAIEKVKETCANVEDEKLTSVCREHGISRATHYLRMRKYRKHSLAGLADGRFGQSRSKLIEAQKNYIVALVKQNPDRRTVRIHEYVLRKYPENPVSGTTVVRYLEKWKATHHELFSFLKNPDQWKNDYQLAFGSQSEKALHFLHYIELDSTPADILCADGKRYNIICAIDIFSRKPKCHVSPTSSGQGVAALFRNVILDWGVPENAVRDNGKDYVSNHINSILKTLDINAITVAPFTPEGKPHIERFFRTLSGGLFEELHGYIGHNVAQRKAIESRRSFAKRMMNSEADPIQLNIYPDELQAIVNRWIEKVYNQRVHKGINDTPEHKAAQSMTPIRRIEDERALDILLVPAGEATVQKKGIRYDKALYQAPELSGWMRERVQVRRDMQDAGRLYVFSRHGQYITTAWDPTIEGMPSIDYAAVRKDQRRRIRDQKAAIATLKEDPMQDLLTAKTGENTLVSLPRKRTAQTAALEEAKTAALRGAGAKPERYKSVAEQMEENGWNETEEGLDGDDLDFLDDLELVNF